MLNRPLILLCLAVLAVGCARAADTDGDGLPDQFEQALLLRFAPQFHISASDCDIAPAEFHASVPDPQVKARNGTVYGQVFPAGRDDAAGSFIEIHFYHLWGRDCGLTHHALDTESVSGLLRAGSDRPVAEAWRAVFWYAAAHEGTLCDMSNGAPAATLGALDRGPDVWISRNKHASFLSRSLCSQGCGGDLCDGDGSLRISRLINLGEPGAPMNGADWSASASWPLASKMAPRYTDALIERMPKGSEVAVLPARDFPRGTRTTINISARTYASLVLANNTANAGLASGARGAASGINVAGAATWKSWKRALRWLNGPSKTHTASQ